MFEDYYQKMVCAGAHVSPPFQPKIITDWLTDLTRQTKIKTALDLCSGLGFNLPILARFSSQILASDISKPALEAAQKNHAAFRNIKYFVCDAHHLKLPKNEFDLVVCTEALEHVKTPEKVISECHRVLKPHGFLIISTPNYQNPTGIIKWFKDKRAGREYWEPWGVHKNGFERRITPDFLHKIITPYLKIKKTRGASYFLAWFYLLPWRKYSDRFPFLRFGKLPVIKKFGMHYYILAQKKRLNFRLID